MTWVTTVKDSDVAIGDRRVQVWTWATTTSGTGGAIITQLGQVDFCVASGNVASTQATKHTTSGTVTITHTSGAAAGKCLVIGH
jgi:hypothetical protein